LINDFSSCEVKKNNYIKTALGEPNKELLSKYL